MGNEPRNHHFLPQAYLKGFTKGGSKKSKLWTLDMEKRRQFETRPRNVGAVRDFMRVEVEGLDPNAFEKALSPFEGDVARVINWVDQHNRLPRDEDFAVLINFIALVGARNPKLRQTMEELESELFKRVVELSVSRREIWESQVERIKESGYDGPELSYEEMRDFVLRSKYELKFPVGYHIEAEFDLVDTILPYLYARKWVLMVAKDHAGHFVCSDRPVAILARSAAMEGTPLGFGVANTDVTIPLNRRLALSGSFEGESFVLPVDRPLVAAMNAHTIAYGERFVYSPARTFEYLTREGIKTQNAFLIHCGV